MSQSITIEILRESVEALEEQGHKQEGGTRCRMYKVRQRLECELQRLIRLQKKEQEKS